MSNRDSVRCERHDADITELKVDLKALKIDVHWIKQTMDTYLNEEKKVIENSFKEHSRAINKRLKIVSFQWFIVLLVMISSVFGWRYYDVYKDMSQIKNTVYKVILSLKNRGVDVDKEFE